jgi:6,7-dimethyl-8-ribityllumazine synthase
MASAGNINPNSLQPGIQQLLDACVVIIRTEWNEDITSELEKGCRNLLALYGTTNIITHIVPGAFELPYAVKKVYENKHVKANAIIALGCIVRGETPHFDYVAKAVTEGLAQLNIELSIPVVFGVLTVNSKEQAMDRIGGKEGHKGEEAALTALKMIQFTAQLKL